MSKLISHVRELIEAAFTSKKEWVSNQSLPYSTSTAIDFPLPASGEWTESITATHHGYIQAVIPNCTAMDISTFAGVRSIITQTTSGYSLAAYVPIRKGTGFNCRFVYTGTPTATFRLIKTVGSS